MYNVYGKKTKTLEMSVSLTSLNVCYPLVEIPLFYVLLISKICYQLNYAL